MIEDKIKQDLAFLTENINSPPDKMRLLRSTLEVSLLKLGYEQAAVNEVLDDYYKQMVH